MITKETKKNTVEVDLKPGIFDFKVNDDGSLYLFVDASSGGNIKPATAIEALLNQYGETLQENACLITREETYTDIGEKEINDTLEDMGNEGLKYGLIVTNMVVNDEVKKEAINMHIRILDRKDFE